MWVRVPPPVFKILNLRLETLFAPNASNIYEFSKRGDDPTDWPEADLSVPPLTPQEEIVAERWQAVNKISKILNERIENPAEILERVNEVVQEALVIKT